MPVGETGGKRVAFGLENFNPANEFNILRIVCGAFFIPHIFGKFFVPAALGFFVAARFKPPAAWMYTAGAVETVLATGLILGLFTSYVAALGTVYLLVAGVAVWRVSNGKWLWTIGGYEYCVFWALCCLVVAMHG